MALPLRVFCVGAVMSSFGACICRGRGDCVVAFYLFVCVRPVKPVRWELTSGPCCKG